MTVNFSFVHLLKGHKNTFLHIRCNSDSRVCHTNLNPFMSKSGTNIYFTLLREFNRIIYQIVQNLNQTVAICMYRWKLWSNIVYEKDRLFSEQKRMYTDNRINNSFQI
ncbi:hypothetical protein D3C78_1015920 [compost metagenome]